MADVTIVEGLDDDNRRSKETEVYGDGSSVQSRSANRYQLILPPVELDFTAHDGTHYLLDCASVIGTGGEGCVVRAYDDEGHGYAAKLAFIMPQYRADNEDILQRLAERTAADPDSYRHDHLMPTYAWGTVSARPLGHDRDTELLVTIMPVCQPLEGERLTAYFVKTVVLAHLAEALKTLHDMNIVHRDVKPANVYELNGVVVLADFGISCPFEEGQSIHDTRTDRRTVGYTPSQNAVMKENDWYSLGYTLWTLYNGGVHPYQPFIEEYYRTRRSDVLAHMEMGFRDIQFAPREPGDETFGQLIFGLTAHSAPYRLGYDDVQRYLADPAGFRYEDEAPVAQPRRPYTFEGVECTDDYRLACELVSKWDRAKRHLYAGNLEEYYRTNGEFDLAASLDEIVERDSATVKNQDLGLARAIWLISGEHRMLYWKGMDVSLPTLIEAFRTEPADRLGRYDQAIASGILSWSLGQTDDEAGPNAVKVMQVVEGVAKDSPLYARCLFQHLFAGGGPSEWAGGTDFEVQAGRVLASPYRVYTFTDGALDDALASFAPIALRLGTIDRLIEGRKAIGQSKGVSALERVERLLVLLDAVGKGSGSVRSFAANHGPKGGWLWVASHTELYATDDSESQGLLRELATEVPSASDDVVTIMRHGDAARHLCDKLFPKMEESPLPAYFGYSSDKAVKTEHADALLCSSFYGEAAPRGFVRALLFATSEADRDSWTQVQLVSDECRAAARNDSSFADKSKDPVAKCANAARPLALFGKPMVRIVVAATVLIALIVYRILTGTESQWTYGLPQRLTEIGIGGFLPASVFVVIVFVVAIAFLLLEQVAAAQTLMSFSVSKYAADECEALRDWGLEAIEGFAEGTSDLAAQMNDVSWGDRIECLDSLRSIDDLTATACGRTGLTETMWYKIAWHASSLLVALLLLLLALTGFEEGLWHILGSLPVHDVNVFFYRFGLPERIWVLVPWLVIFGFVSVAVAFGFERNSISWVALVLVPNLLWFAVEAVLMVIVAYFWAIVIGALIFAGLVGVVHEFIGNLSE